MLVFYLIISFSVPYIFSFSACKSRYCLKTECTSLSEIFNVFYFVFSFICILFIVYNFLLFKETKASSDISILESNPKDWSVEEVEKFILASDCAPVAKLLKEEVCIIFFYVK